MLVAVKVAALDAALGRRDTVVEAMVPVVVYSEGVYFEKEMRLRGID